MSIRDLAKELYRLEREVEDLEGRLKAAPLESRDDIQLALRRAKGERDRYRAILAAKKEPPPRPRTY
jgi:hypothetical protein